MAKSEVLIEMPEFEKKYNLAMVESEKGSSRVRPKQFLHIFQAEQAFFLPVFAKKRQKTKSNQMKKQK